MLPPAHPGREVCLKPWFGTSYNTEKCLNTILLGHLTKCNKTKDPHVIQLRYVQKKKFHMRIAMRTAAMTSEA